MVLASMCLGETAWQQEYVAEELIYLILNRKGREKERGRAGVRDMDKIPQEPTTSQLLSSARSCSLKFPEPPQTTPTPGNVSFNT
jgi:hypothetical protein